LIQCLPKTHRYRLTDFGLRTALFCTRSYARIFRRGLGMVLCCPQPLPFPTLCCAVSTSSNKKSTLGLMRLEWLLET